MNTESFDVLEVTNLNALDAIHMFFVFSNFTKKEEMSDFIAEHAHDYGLDNVYVLNIQKKSGYNHYDALYFADTGEWLLKDGKFGNGGKDLFDTIVMLYELVLEPELGYPVLGVEGEFINAPVTYGRFVL